MFFDSHELISIAYKNLRKEIEHEIAVAIEEIKRLEILKLKKKIWEDTIYLSGKTSSFFSDVAPETIVVPENVEQQVGILKDKVNKLEIMLGTLEKMSKRYE